MAMVPALSHFFYVKHWWPISQLAAVIAGAVTTILDRLFRSGKLISGIAYISWSLAQCSHDSCDIMRLLGLNCNDGVRWIKYQVHVAEKSMSKKVRLAWGDTENRTIEIQWLSLQLDLKVCHHCSLFTRRWL